MVHIRPMKESDRDMLVPLLAHFRVTLSRFHGRPLPTNFAEADRELLGYQEPGYKIFIAENDEEFPVAYLVCRIENDVVWADSFFVLPDYRRQGVGSALYQQAQALAEEMGGETVYNWVHPNNERMIGFLRRHGYRVLNMIEIRKSTSNDEEMSQVKVGVNSFDYCC
jgi:ribosomal protein S18 acetylase RimI-like enzyme